MNLYFLLTNITEDRVITPDYSDLKFSLKNENSKAIFEINGNLILSGEDYKNFKNDLLIFTPTIKCYLNGNIFFISKFGKYNIIKENESFNTIYVKIFQQTEYVSNEWLNFDKEYNINLLPSENIPLRYEINLGQQVDRVQETLFSSIQLNNTTIASYEISDWDISEVIIISSQLIGGIWYYSGSFRYFRFEAEGYYLGIEKYDPDGILYTAPGEWQFIYDRTMPEGVIPVFKKVKTAIYEYTPDIEPYNIIENVAFSTSYYTKIDYNKVVRRVDLIIPFLFEKIGLTNIMFDTSGTVTDSFYSFKNLTGESLTKGLTTSDKIFKDLLIINLTDFIPAPDNTQKDVHANRTNLSLKRILDYLLQLGFEWYLQNREGVFYFMLQHISDKILNSNNPNLSNYFNNDYIYLSNNYEIDEPEYSLITNDTTCLSSDFIGTDIIFPDIIFINKSFPFTNTNIFVDIDDIIERKGEEYSEIANNNIVVIVALKDGTNKYYVRNALGKISGSHKNNSELSFPYVIQHLSYNLPASEISANNNTYTIEDFRLKKRKKITLTIPINNLIEDFEINSYIAFFGENCEIEQIQQNATDNVGKIILKAL